MMRILIAAAIFLMHGQSAKALLLWNWSYSGAGISASGTFTTNDTPDGAGFYQIVGISGTDNGATITSLQPTGTAIPGNEPYAVDNLVSAVEPRLTTHGFGFSLANGNYANPFYNGSSYYEYLSVPPYVNGAGPEKPVSFAARHCSGAERSLAHACGSRRPHQLRPNLYAPEGRQMHRPPSLAGTAERRYHTPGATLQELADSYDRSIATSRRVTRAA